MQADEIIAGVDIGGTKTAVLLWDREKDTVLGQETFATPAESGPQALLDGVDATLDSMFKQNGQSRSRLKGIGIAVPGRVDTKSGTVISAGNLADWENLALRELSEERLHIPTAIEHDASAAALGERWRGTAQTFESFAFIALGTGVGVGIILNGQLVRGAHHAAGELGDLVVGREFLGQDRAGVGNLAHLIGGKTLRRRAAQKTGTELSAAEAIAWAEEDADLAVMAEEVADYLAIAIIAIATLLDPQAIVVGGGTAEAGEDLLDPVRERVAREVVTAPRLIPSALGSDAQVYGAVFAAWQALTTNDLT
jgi:predicted NBD/HSP70 family sugar kinase